MSLFRSASLTIAAFMLAGTSAVFAQRPDRPADSYGKKGGRPAALPERPAESWGKKGGGRDGAQRPPESRGGGQNRPGNVPGRPR